MRFEENRDEGEGEGDGDGDAEAEAEAEAEAGDGGGVEEDDAIEIERVGPSEGHDLDGGYESSQSGSVYPDPSDASGEE